MHTYWATGAGVSYAQSNPYVIGAYLYAPAFAQILSPFTALPWPWFAALWTAALAAVYVWLSGRWAFPLLLLTGAVALELYLGQIDLFIAAAVVIGFRYPAVWAFPLLTKVAPGIGLAVVRGAQGVAESRHRAHRDRRHRRGVGAPRAGSCGATGTTSSAGASRTARSSRARTSRSRSGSRLPFAVAIIVWGARTDRHWTVPIGILLAMPILWLNVFTLLIAFVPLREEFGLTPARAWLLRERLLPDAVKAKQATVPQAG